MTMDLTHGYNHGTNQEYAIDEEEVWDHWHCTPGPEREGSPLGPPSVLEQLSDHG